MLPLPITLVAGPSGCGKTTWIHEQLSASASAVYVGLGSELLIDERYLSISFPDLRVMPEPLVESSILHEQIAKGLKIYVEVGFYIDLERLNLPFDSDLCRRVAIIPPGSETESAAWADEVVVGAPIGTSLEVTQVWRSPLTGQILDPPSLDTFWYELTQGAYGAVHRAKGIFDLVDGRAFYFNYVAGLPNTQYVELKVPRWFEGRPERLSGIEITGNNFDQKGIASTMKDCGLEDAAIAYYQAQIKESLGEKAAA
jgi:hypothetical protein